MIFWLIAIKVILLGEASTREMWQDAYVSRKPHHIDDRRFPNCIYAHT
jgi:hypothetical protein